MNLSDELYPIINDRFFYLHHLFLPEFTILWYNVCYFFRSYKTTGLT